MSLHSLPESAADRTRDALKRLGIERLVLSIHQLSFPAGDDDIGIGSPYGAAARRFLSFVADLGFDGVALGPAGITSRENPSPYDASLFSLNPAFVAVHDLLERGLVSEDVVARVVRGSNEGWGGGGRGPRRADHARSWDAARDIMRAARAAFRVRGRADDGDDDDGPDALAGDARLSAEARFEGAAAAAGSDDWRRWPREPPVQSAAADAFLVGQWILRRQHARLRASARELGLKLYADAQVGVSFRDVYLNRGLFLDEYAMGAPPSRTNPDGQPWSYPVLDPAQVAQPESAARRFLVDRFRWLAQMHDGIRIDHPHGWVCPWVYRRDESDALRAVQRGARLHESPQLTEEHAALAAYARVRRDQIDESKARHDDEWVRAGSLSDEQVREYATQLAILTDGNVGAGGANVDRADMLVEVLSTCPTPLGAVLAHLGLGRFRVTQKARVDVPDDVYRSDNAGALDWIMVGNHDTPPLRRVVEGWRGTPECAKRAAYLARRLEPRDDGARAALEERLVRDASAMSEAMLADCFVGPARRVIVFWADVFGETESYNRPGVVHEDNWTLRVPPDFATAHALAVDAGHAPSLDRALQLALHARDLAP